MSLAPPFPALFALLRNAFRVTLKLRVQRTLSTRHQYAVAAFATRAVQRWHRYYDEVDNWLENTT